MLNRIAAAQNYTTKEGFPMRSVAFKALAVLVGLAVLMIAAPGWRSETAQTQTSAARAELTINGGCNYLPITLGTLTNFRVQITYLDLRIFPNGQADFALVLQGPQGTFTFGNDPNAQPNLLGLRVGDVRYFNSQGVLQGLGWRTLSLLVDVNPDPAAVQYQLVVRCYYQGVNGPPGTSETQVTIQARTSQGPLNGVPIGFFYDPLQNGPATNGATTFFTPYTENFPKGMRIRLRAEDQVVVEGIIYRFIRWEFRDDPWGTFCYLSRGAVVECVLGYPLNSIAFTAVYEPEQPPTPPGGQLVTLFINAWRLPGSPPNPALVPLRIVIRQPEAACPQPMGQCPGDEVIPFYLLRLDGAMPFTRQLPANTAIQIEALPVVGRTFVRFDRQDQGRVVSSDRDNPVTYSVLPCWGAEPCNAPNGPITVTAVYR
jgi:hypothetical protein